MSQQKYEPRQGIPQRGAQDIPDEGASISPLPTVSTSSENTQNTQDTHQSVQAIASQIDEDPTHLVQRKDITQVLERMKEGVTVTLHISRQRFWSKLTLEDLGLAVGGELTTSEEATAVLNDYFQLGRRSLLPKVYQDKLANAESSARYCLAKYSFKSHWGAFIPLTTYPLWKEDNARHEAAFWALKEELLTRYTEITEQVVEASRPLAEDAWRRVMLGTAVLKQMDRLSTRLLSEVIERLHAGRGKETFIENYLACIRRAIPKREEIADAFAYDVERGVIPLPSLLARDMEDTDRIYQERALRDAQVRAELEAIEAQRRAELQKLSEQQRLECEEQYLRLQAERERQRLQLEMERDVLADARRRKEQLVREFYSGIVLQINELITDVSQNVLESLDEHDGQLRGPVSNQLRNLVAQLERMNFVEDEQIERQFARLRTALPTQAESEAAARGVARIDTTRIRQVVRQVAQEAQETIVNLGQHPKTRGRGLREMPLDTGALISLGQRKARTPPVLSAVEPDEVTTKRRRRNKQQQANTEVRK